jgi:glycosyltransferase involved in cell wall biosynthesis
MPLRVGFDVSALLAGDTGVARYVAQLGDALERCDVELLRFAIGRGAYADALPAGTRRLRLALRVVHRAGRFASIASADRLAPGAQVVHVPDLVPAPSELPLVLTVHDLVALEHPELHPLRAQRAQRAQLEAARDRASIVLAVSHATADVLHARGVARERIIVTPNAVTCFPPPDPALVPDGPFLLAVGSVNPRKGLDVLAGAFARADLPTATRLVLAGPDGWDATRVHDAIRGHGLGARVICTGRVTDAQLAALYGACTAVCVASVGEGFGLPVLEAAPLGAPVLAADLPVFREIDGAVTLFATPGDTDDWAAKLARIVADDDLRRDGAQRARDAARPYTWQRTAQLTVAAYELARAGR